MIGDFINVGDIEVAADSSIFVPDVHGVDLPKYASDGRLIRRIGGRGRGPGEFAGGPNHMALVNGDLLISDSRGFAVHRFDTDLSYIQSLRPLTPMTKDAGPDGRIYMDIPDILSDQYVTVLDPDGAELTKWSIDELSEHSMENIFRLLADRENRIVQVFQAINHIDIRDRDGRLLGRMSVPELPKRIPGSFMDLRELVSPVPEQVATAHQAARYVPGGLVFTGAVLDHKGHILLEGGGDVGSMPLSRQMYVMNFSGEVKSVVNLPPRMRLVEADRSGNVYLVEATLEGNRVHKYRMVYRGFD